MTILTSVHHCRLPLAAPLALCDGSIAHRDTILLNNESGDWAEAAPLPGFSRENTEDVLASLTATQADIAKCPSLQFAVDSLAHSHWPTTNIPINALLTGSAAEFSARAERLAESKCRTVKLKVGSVTLEEDIERVRLLRSTLRTDQTLRLDANRAWDWPTAIEFATAISKLGTDAVEYIEEPLADSARLEEFSAATHCPYALDETLLDDVSLDRFSSAAALIIKPTLIGSIQRIDSLAAIGKPLVFSGCFESGIGTLQIARLAAKFSPDIPAGLDTYSRLSEDVLATPLQMNEWNLNIDGPPRVDMNKIAELSA